MKKKFLFCAVMILGSLLVSCSSDDGYSSYEETGDAKLQYTKNLILSYGQKYGLENIQFDDELLKKNLNLPKEEFEKCVINMAISMGKVKPTSKLIRKLRRSQDVGEEEPGGEQQPYYYVMDTKNLSYKADDYLYKFTVSYLFVSTGLRALEVKDNKADVYRLKLCSNPNCNIKHEINLDENAICSSIESSPIGGGVITFEEGATADLTIHYSVHISYTHGDYYQNCNTSGFFYSSTKVKKSYTFPMLL
ncbi:hypothetical protein [Prevotella sp. E2-28]|uniref:hypothetical protein n=1 Tax=Prevotella sp. E2-28 TaxID=2913620 RepID=UPI001EDA40DE|nr:hypothetical protein [Prevotella sp. E2-28]UKK53724.1 hypothetical protein L6465_00180 [Prevotella sp. E2-28]